MLKAGLKAIRDVLSPEFRRILWKALGLTIVLFAVILFALEMGLSAIPATPWPWLDTVISYATGLGAIAAFVFLMAPVTAIFAGIFLDDVAEIVERRDYPHDPPGRPQTIAAALLMAVQYGLIVLAVNLVALPALFFAIGPVVMLLANAYLLGREYFSMAAMRHMPWREASALRRRNAGRIFAAGLIPAALALVPFVSIILPLFATSYFVHIYKQIAGSASDHVTVS